MEGYFLTHFFVSCFLCGLIWLIQLVHYPAFLFVDEKEFVKFEGFHTKNISLIVVPAMLLELLTAIVLVQQSTQFAELFRLNLAMVIGIWFVTFTFSVPCHKKLASAKDHRAIKRLVRTNWLRTFLWTVKSFLLIYLSVNIFSVSV